MDLGLLHVMVLSITYGTAAQQQRNFMGCKNLSTGVPALLCAHQADKMVLWWCLHCLACKPGLQAREHPAPQPTISAPAPAG